MFTIEDLQLDPTMKMNPSIDLFTTSSLVSNKL